MVPLRVPIVVDSMNWPTSRKANLAIAILSAVAALATWHGYLGTDEGTQKVLLVLIAAFVSLAVNGAKDVIAYKK